MANIVIQIFVFLNMLYLICCYYNVHKGDLYWWSFADSYYVTEQSIQTSDTAIKHDARSFVECCTKCDVSQGCSGVAYRTGECNILNGTTPNSLIPGNNQDTDYKVMMYDTTDRITSHIKVMEPECAGTRCEVYNRCPYGSQCTDIMNKLVDCKYLYELGYTTDGVYTINPDDTVPFEAYCDMTNGGWTVFQRRQDASTDFYRGYAEYTAGFGSLTGNLWLGLGHLHSMTSMYTSEIHVYMDTFEGETAEASYSSFSVGDSSSGYQLSVSGYSGNAGDGMAKHNGMKFSTYDMDQDTHAVNCAVTYKGGFWYQACHDVNLNGQYLGGAHTSYADGVNWESFKGDYYSLKTSIMKIRRY